jgi:hypothetical protein
MLRRVMSEQLLEHVYSELSRGNTEQLIDSLADDVGTRHESG